MKHIQNNHDKLFINLFYRKRVRVSTYRKFIHNPSKYPNINGYLLNRFNDIEENDTYLEIINRILYKIESKPKCKICNNYAKYSGIKPLMYYNCCCQSHTSKYAIMIGQKTCLKKYGVKYVVQSKEVKEKSKQTCLEKYGVTNGGGSKQALEKIKETNLKRRGVEYVFQDKDIREKMRESLIKKYGVDHNLKSKEIQEIIKQTNLKLYGCENPMQNEAIIQKGIDTKRKNHTFNVSKPEEELYLYIKEKIPSVIRQYQDYRYSWSDKLNRIHHYLCDFYIPELDLFIEFNGFPCHGPHSYNPDSKEDQELVEKWKLRYKNGKHPLYKRMINGWTISDVKKRKIAKENNLNYYEFWTLKEAKKFISESIQILLCLIICFITFFNCCLSCSFMDFPGKSGLFGRIGFSLELS